MSTAKTFRDRIGERSLSLYGPHVTSDENEAEALLDIISENPKFWADLKQSLLEQDTAQMIGAKMQTWFEIALAQYDDRRQQSRLESRRGGE
jgi:hypothetical protein